MIIKKIALCLLTTSLISHSGETLIPSTIKATLRIETEPTFDLRINVQIPALEKASHVLSQTPLFVSTIGAVSLGMFLCYCGWKKFTDNSKFEGCAFMTIGAFCIFCGPRVIQGING